ncbi:MAG: hypothetical protein ACRDD8_05280 [Bacteroidales bacterium]
MSDQIKLKDITKKYTDKVTEMTSMQNEYEDKIKELKRQNLKLVKAQVRKSNEEKYKSVLRLYANGFGVGLIYKTLVEEEGEEITIDEIRSLIDRVDILDTELRQYYFDCKKEFAENVKVNKDFFASTIYKKFQLLENVVSEELITAQEVGDSETIMKCVTELKNIYKEMSSTFFKNGFDSGGNTMVVEIKDSYNRNKEKKISMIKGLKVM